MIGMYSTAMANSRDYAFNVPSQIMNRACKCRHINNSPIPPHYSSLPRNKFSPSPQPETKPITISHNHEHASPHLTFTYAQDLANSLPKPISKMARLLNLALLLTFLAPLTLAAPTTPSNALEERQTYTIVVCYPGCYVTEECDKCGAQ